MDYDKKQDKMSSYNNTTRRFPAAFGGQRRGGGGGYGGQRRYQEVAYPAPEKKEAPKTVDLTSEMNFPSLGASDGWTTAKPIPSTGSTFATLAQKWKKDEEDEEERIRFEKEQAEKKKLEDSRYITTSRILSRGYAHDSKHADYEEDVDDEYDQYAELDKYEQMMNRQKSEEDDWATVERR